MFDPNLLPQHAHHHGFWLVDDTPVFSKIKAILYAQEKNTENVKFYFHNNVYDNCDWTVAQTPLLDLYIKRAEQLRNNYDYLIFAYSGGSDSSNALKTFLYNNIKIDELLVWYTSHNEKNVLTNAEINYAAADMISRCNKEYNIKINKVDISEYFAKCKIVGNEWILGTDHSLVIEQIVKPEILYNNPHWLKLVDSGKRVAIILGLEKPRIFYKNKKWYAGFLDVTNSYNFEKYHYEKPPLILEQFYRTPDYPQITISQSHAVANFISQTYDKKFIVDNFSNDGNFNQKLYYKIVRNSIYPYWDDNTFSIGKTRGGILIDKYEWAWNSNTDLANEYLRSLDLLKNEIDKHWLNRPNNHIYGIRGIWSKIYCLS